MSLPQSTKYVVFIILAAVTYYWAVLFGVQLAASTPRPEWWEGASRALTVYSWLHFAHAVGLLLVSAPFALMIHFSRFRRPVLIAFAVAALGLVASIDFARLLDASEYSKYSAALDLLKFIGTLPLVTWLVGRKMPSNNSFKPKPLRGSA